MRLKQLSLKRRQKVNLMTDKPLLQFPCKFPIKAMGLATPGFQSTVFNIVKQHVPDLKESDLSARPSKDGKYLAITINIEASSQQQLDKIYMALNDSKEVTMCL